MLGSQAAEMVVRRHAELTLLAHAVTADYRPGPALKRLTPSQRTWLDQNLVLLLRPDHTWAEEIRQSRQAGRSGMEAT